MAIDSNKRDRRHSDNMDFMAPAAQLQRDMDSNLSPVVTTTPQGIQLISSPTMAMPHASIPPYSGGFIVTGGPGGTHMVASPHLVQMTPHGIPIVMPTHTIPVSTHSQLHPPPLSSQSQATMEDKDDVQSHASGESVEPPPAKRPALQEAVKVGGSRVPYSIHQTSTGNFIMATHGGGMASPQLIQMGGPGQLPIVMSAGSLPPTAVRDTSPHINGKTDAGSHPESGHSVVAHHPSSAVLSQRNSSNPHNARNLFHHPNLPGLIIPQQIGAPLPVPQNGEEKRKTEQDRTASNSNPAAIKMPFANISIQPGKTCFVLFLSGFFLRLRA